MFVLVSTGDELMHLKAQLLGSGDKQSAVKMLVERCAPLHIDVDAVMHAFSIVEETMRVSEMPAFGTILSDQEINHVAAYIASGFVGAED